MGSMMSDLGVIHAGSQVQMGGKCKANIADHKPFINIKPFGQCRSLANPTVAAATAANWGVLRPMPCMPNTPSPWMPGKFNVLVKGQPALLDGDKLFCTWAGIIEITNPGQNKTQTGATGITKPYVRWKPVMTQTRVLQKAAEEDTPFCEECESSDEAQRKVAENPKILEVCWRDENGNSGKLEELEENQKVTLCVEVEQGGVGKKISVEIKDKDKRKFKGGKESLKFTELTVESDDTAYIDNFVLEYEED
jgi:hypothetical protein